MARRRGPALVLLLLAAACGQPATQASAPDTSAANAPAPAEPGKDAFPGFALLDRAPEVLLAHRDALSDDVATLAVDEDAALDRLAAIDPDGVARARREARPIGDDIADVHAVCAELFARLADAYPTLRLRRGGHPHPTSLPPVTTEIRARALLDVLAVRRWLAAHPPADTATPHERNDRAVLERQTAEWLWDVGVDADLAHLGVPTVVDLWRLAVVECCPEAERRAALAACLRSVPEYLDSTIGAMSVGVPTRRMLASALTSDADRLRWFHEAFRELDPELSAAEGVAADALEVHAERLRDLTASSRPTVWMEAQSRYASWVTSQVGAPIANREILDRAVAEVRRVAGELRALRAGPPPDVPPSERVRTPAERLGRLAAAAAAFVGELPGDPGVRFAPVRDHGTWWGALLYAPAPGDDAVPSAYVGTWPQSGTLGTWARHENARRTHTAAHEAYPGHHLQIWLSRDACALRRLLPSRILQEGWATYATELVHARGLCGGDSVDRYALAVERGFTALGAAIEVLVCTGATTHETLRTELRVDDEPGTGPWFASTGRWGAQVPYFLGRLEIERLRRRAEQEAGAVFDAAGFHRRLLTLGPLPPRLLERELLDTAAGEGR